MQTRAGNKIFSNTFIVTVAVPRLVRIAPRTNPEARYTILSDAGGRVLVVLDFAKAPRLALVGDRISRAMIDLLPGGDLEER